MGTDHLVHNEQHDAGVLWGCVSFRVVESRSVEMLWPSPQKKAVICIFRCIAYIDIYCLYIYLCINLFVSVFIYLVIYFCMYLFIYLFICLSI